MMKHCLSLLITLVLLTGVARADQPNQVLPPKTRITIPEKPPIDLKVHHFLINRPTIDKANATYTANQRLTSQLKECRALHKPTKSSKWKWIGWGASVGAAFTLGILVSR